MIVFKKTGTFHISGQLTSFADGVAFTDMTGWTGASELRTADGVLVSNLNFTWTDAAQRLFTLSVADPSGWPLGTHNFDILMTSPTGDVIPTHTGQIQVIPGVTNA